MKKKLLFVSLLLGVVFAAVSQENDALLNLLDGILSSAEERLAPSEEETGESMPSFSVYNDTGFAARGIYIRAAAEKNWGGNILTTPLSSGKRIVINLEQSYDAKGLYSVRMVDVDGDSYVKDEQQLRDGFIIKLEIDDFEWDK